MHVLGQPVMGSAISVGITPNWLLQAIVVLLFVANTIDIGTV